MRGLAETAAIAVFLAAGGGLAAAGEEVGGRPNVLLILVDDLGFSDLGCYGGEVPTPNLDGLAAGGVRFSAFCTSARCCPSRASLMTGLHPHQAGIGSFTTERPQEGWGPAYAGHLLPTCVTLAELLRDAGYSTWMVGKWHLGIPGPIERGFQHYYGFRNLLAHSESQWEPRHYVRLPEGTAPELARPDGTFYATDVFTDYALEFIRQARAREGQPWFLYLAHSSPHFPIHAPRESIDRNLVTYRRGWDVLRAERLERMKQVGVVPPETVLPPRSMVPVDRDDIANGYPGRPNPAWDELPADRREDLAYRMATFAAMVEHVDGGVGRIVADLEAHGDLANTLILFLSDNGACYEWGPLGFDGPSRAGTTKLHRGGDLLAIGQPGSYQSYGSGWANLGNTPLNLYKHFCHEGGLASPLIVHWPSGLAEPAAWVHAPGHVMDILPTICDVAGVAYPERYAGQATTPVEGISLLPALRGETLPERALAFEHQAARALRRGEWKVAWGKRMPAEPAWELYNLQADRSEQHNLAGTDPERTLALAREWEAWAIRVGAEPFQNHGAGPRPAVNSPDIRQREVTVVCTFVPPAERANGVLVAQGGREHGFAVHLVDGCPAFDVRIRGEVTRVLAVDRVAGETTVRATLTGAAMTLAVNGEAVAETVSPGLLPVQPLDPLSVGEDTFTAAGDYPAPNPFAGAIRDVNVDTRSTPAPTA